MQAAKTVIRMTSVAASLMLLAALMILAPRAAAQSMGSVSGDIKDVNAKPFPDVTVELKSKESGLTFTVKTDKNGHFVQIGMRPGIYDVKVSIKDKDGVLQTGYETNARVTPGEDFSVSVNFKDILAKQGTAQVEARKKQEEEQKKFQGMKEHFDLGKAALDEARELSADVKKLPADKRAASQEKLNGLCTTAISEFDASQKAAGEKDPNLHLVMYNLGSSYDIAGKNDEAIAAYQKAIELRPTQAAYYNVLGNVFARAGKIPEAGQAYQKSAELDPTAAAGVWLNYGKVLYNANRLQDAADPLRKATTLDPKNADAWYLLGASLLASIETKQEGSTLKYIVQPGTVEAYQKYLDLAPTGHFSADAKAALQGLASLGAGVETKVKVKKKG